MAELQLKGIGKQYDDGSRAVKGIDLTVNNGEFMVLVGPSGCGKSTTLRMIAGLEDATEGNIMIDGTDVTDVDPAKRGVAMVFQSYALYPHMTVEQNMGFGLRMAGMAKRDVSERVAAAARSLQLESLLQRLPRQLSGGQRQRVAIGRSIVRNPKVFLFDEPLSNLDAALRTQMRGELSALHKRLNATIVYVTHDQVEAMTLGDRIAIFNQGRIEQVGAPMELYLRPANRFVACFLGSPQINMLSAYAFAALTGGTGKTCHEIGVRPEHLHWDVESDASISAGLVVTVSRVENLGDVALVHCETNDSHQSLIAKSTLTIDRLPVSGQTLHLRADAKHLISFNEDGSALYDQV